MPYTPFRLALIGYGILLGYQAHKHDVVNRAVARTRETIREIQRDSARAYFNELSDRNLLPAREVPKT
jgi:hypothetical protein